MASELPEQWVSACLCNALASSGEEARLDWAGRGDLFVPGDHGPPQVLRAGLREHLRRALDRALADEALRLAEAGADVATFVRVVRGRAEAEIDRLASAEDRRVAAWLALPQVREESWCLTFDRVPAALQHAVWTSARQQAAWAAEGPAPTEPSAHLVVDTTLLPAVLTAELLLTAGLDQQCDGWLIHGDNARGLRWLAEWFTGRVQCIYIDPPFNSGNRDFAYVDRLPRGQWLTMMH